MEKHLTWLRNTVIILRLSAAGHFVLFLVSRLMKFLRQNVMLLVKHFKKYAKEDGDVEGLLFKLWKHVIVSLVSVSTIHSCLVHNVHCCCNFKYDQITKWNKEKTHLQILIYLKTCNLPIDFWVHHVTNQKPSLQNCLLNWNRNKHAENA